MYFREYSGNGETLREWSKQLNIVTKENFPLYETVDNTLEHWKYILNRTLDTNTFDLSDTNENTIYVWKQKLNNIYNR